MNEMEFKPFCFTCLYGRPSPCKTDRHHAIYSSSMSVYFPPIYRSMNLCCLKADMLIYACSMPNNSKLRNTQRRFYHTSRLCTRCLDIHSPAPMISPSHEAAATSSSALVLIASRGMGIGNDDRCGLADKRIAGREDAAS